MTVQLLGLRDDANVALLFQSAVIGELSMRGAVRLAGRGVVDVRHGTLTDYLGDYDRYLEKQEGGAASAEANAGSEPASESAAKQRKQARIADRGRERELLRTLQRARRRLTAIEADLIEREEELEDLSNQLTEPHIYRDGEAVRSIEVARAELQTAIEEGYANWESVAAEIETAEAAGES